MEWATNYLKYKTILIPRGMKQASTQLLTKISVLFLILIIAAFCINATFLIAKLNRHIENNVNHSFSHNRDQISSLINKGASAEEINDIHNVQITKLDKSSAYPSETTIDTTMMDEFFTESHKYRLKKEIISINNSDYLLTMRKNIEDFINLKSDITNALLPILLVIAIITILLSIFLSRYLFKPFYSILNQMENFSVIENFSFQKTKTTTKEFCIMQRLYLQMIEHIESDYNKLKEYTENMAHEIQTPLTILRNKTEDLIEDDSLMESHSKTIVSINNEINHLSKLSKTLRLLTKIENNEYTKREAILTKDFLEDHIEKLEELAELKSLSLKSKLNWKHQLIIDPLLLEIIIKNLLRNAILYSPRETTINIETSNSTLLFSNFGEQSLNTEKLFKRFSRGSDNKSSLGLGLAIVKKICDINNLEISYTYLDMKHIFKITKINDD